MSEVPLTFQKLSILVAAYQEQETLRASVRRMLAAPLPGNLAREVVLVDDGSRDLTWEIAQELAATHPEVRVFRQHPNQGKGAAIRRAIAEMQGDLAIFQDADLEYDPSDYRRLLAPILSGHADVVFGSRFAGQDRRVLYFWHTKANELLTLISNMLNDTNWTDMETCYKAFIADELRSIPLESNRFGIEPEIAAKVARNRLRMYEVPIAYNGRTYEEGKKITWRDGAAALWFIFKYRFTSRYAGPGKTNLSAMAPKFNQWVYESLKPWLGQRVVELGVGRGNLSRFLRRHAHVLLTDYHLETLQKLHQLWQHSNDLRIAKLDMTVAADYAQIRDYQPDTIVFSSVLEHIEDDRAVLANLFAQAPAGCRLVVLVPYQPSLFSEADRQLGHFRRYGREELEEKMIAAGWKVETQFYFNKFGVVAWYLANTVGGQKSIGRVQLKLYNFCIPLFRFLDRVLPTAGLSTVVVARKPVA